MAEGALRRMGVIRGSSKFLKVYDITIDNEQYLQIMEESGISESGHHLLNWQIQSKVKSLVEETFMKVQERCRSDKETQITFLNIFSPEYKGSASEGVREV